MVEHYLDSEVNLLTGGSLTVTPALRIRPFSFVFQPQTGVVTALRQ